VLQRLRNGHRQAACDDRKTERLAHREYLLPLRTACGWRAASRGKYRLYHDPPPASDCFISLDITASHRRDGEQSALQQTVRREAETRRYVSRRERRHSVLSNH